VNVEDSLIVYVTDKKPVRRFQLGAKADRFLALGLVIPGALFLLSSAWKLVPVWQTTTWEDEARLIPSATIAVALVLLGLAGATWARRNRLSAGGRVTWFSELVAAEAEPLAESEEDPSSETAA
jgi:hypothetical protein